MSRCHQKNCAMAALTVAIAAVASMAEVAQTTAGGTARRYVVTEGPEWAALPHFEGLRAGTALDFSASLDAPAGKYGFARAVGGRMEFEELPGVAQRFCGANLCFSANYVNGADAERLADEFARMGYNIVRFHHFDGALAPNGGGALDSVKLERLDALAAAFKRRGIYITLDLYVNRRTPVLPGEDKRVSRGAYKALVWADPVCEADFLAFATNFLNHVNPHTGVAWKEEPAVVDIDIVNEDTLAKSAVKAEALPVYARLFGEWLAAHQGLADATGGVPDATTSEGQESRLWKAFLVEWFRDRYARMAGMLRAAGVRQMLSDQNYNWDMASNLQRGELDVVEAHFYCRHPKFLGGNWRLPAVVETESTMREFGGPLADHFRQRIAGKPFLVTEWDYPVPNPHAAEGAFLAGAYAALQDWSGLVRFAWSHNEGALRPPYQGVPGFFDCATDPLRRLSEIAAVLFFLRGDVQSASGFSPYALRRDEFLRDNALSEEPGAALNRIGLVTRTGTRIVDGDGAAGLPAFVPEPEDGVWRSETGELELDAVSARFRAVTPRSEAFLLEPGAAADGGVASAENTGPAPCAVLAAAIDDRPLGDSGRILLLALTQSLPAGCTLSGERRQTVESWGKGPMLVRRSTVAISLRRNLAGFVVHPLLPDGTRLPAESLPQPDESGAVRMTLDVSKALAWEIVRAATR